MMMDIDSDAALRLLAEALYAESANTDDVVLLLHPAHHETVVRQVLGKLPEGPMGLTGADTLVIDTGVCRITVLSATPATDSALPRFADARRIVVVHPTGTTTASAPLRSAGEDL